MKETINTTTLTLDEIYDNTVIKPTSREIDQVDIDIETITVGNTKIEGIRLKFKLKAIIIIALTIISLFHIYLS